MKSEDDAPLTTFAIPVEGLRVSKDFLIGVVEIFPSVDELPFLDSVSKYEDFEKSIVRSGEEYRAVAVVECASIDIALEMVAEALSVLRVFQYSQTQFANYTHFGIPGEIKAQKIFYYKHGSEGSGPAFRGTGLHLGYNFSAEAIDDWEKHPLCLLAATAINNPEASLGAKLALNGARLFAQSILVKDPDFRVLLVIAALEGMLSQENGVTGRYSLARMLTYLSCWNSGSCGNIQGKPCPYLLFDPDLGKEERGLLKKLGNMAREDVRWRCSDWLEIDDWYQTRSGVAHGRPEGTDSKDAANFAYRSYRRGMAPALTWLQEHPTSPAEDLVAALKELKADGIDWKTAVKTGVMPNTNSESPPSAPETK